MSMQIENLNNYELAIRERDAALAKVAQLTKDRDDARLAAEVHLQTVETQARIIAGQAAQAPIQSGELTANKLTECRHCGFYVALNRAPADVPAQQQASTAPAPVLRKLSDVMRKDPMSPEDFGLNGEHANKARAYHTAMMAEAAQEQAAVVPAGWKLVPVKPTEDMVDATNLKIGGCYSCAASIPSWEECAEIYADMLAAAPAPPVAQAHALTDAEIDEIAYSIGGSPENHHRRFARALLGHLTRKG